MRKTDKKIDKQLRQQLTQVCEQSLEEVHGFQWLTHLVNFERFPDSLQVVCVFDTEFSKKQYLASGSQFINTLIASKLSALGVNLRTCKQLVKFDSEEKCDLEHEGNWAKRLQVK